MPCKCCGSPIPENPTIIGIQYGLADEPVLILWNCPPPCGTTRAIRWLDSTQAQRVAANLADLSRDSENEMMG